MATTPIFYVGPNSLDATTSYGGKDHSQLRGNGAGPGTGVALVPGAGGDTFGANYIDQYQGVIERMGLCFSGLNLPLAGAPISVVHRLAVQVPAVDVCLWSFAGISAESHGLTKAFMGAGGANWYFAITDDYNREILAQTNTNVALTATVWTDLVWTWTGDTSANGMGFWKNGVLVSSATASRATVNPAERTIKNIAIGYVPGITTTRIWTKEFAIYDYVINPANVPLVGGPGSLSGAARVSPLLAPAHDALASTVATGRRRNTMGRF